jgi:hypothetical protein
MRKKSERIDIFITFNLNLDQLMFESRRELFFIHVYYYLLT